MQIKSKKTLKRCLGVLLALTLSLTCFIPAFAGQWEYDGYGGWWYLRDDGSYPIGKWEQINGIWYYFHDDGYMIYDCQTPDGYWVDYNGAWIQSKAPTAIYRNPITVGEVVNTVYYNRFNSNQLELGQFSEDGTIYANLTAPDGTSLWYGTEVERYVYMKDGYGIRLAGYGNNAGESLTITWTSRESMDYPNVYYIGNRRIYEFAGDYDYYYKLEGTN